MFLLVELFVHQRITTDITVKRICQQYCSFEKRRPSGNVHPISDSSADSPRPGWWKYSSLLTLSPRHQIDMTHVRSRRCYSVPGRWQRICGQRWGEKDLRQRGTRFWPTLPLSVTPGVVREGCRAAARRYFTGSCATRAVRVGLAICYRK